MERRAIPRCLLVAAAVLPGAAALAAPEPAAVGDRFRERLPDVIVQGVDPARVPGWYRVTTPSLTVYTDAEARWMLRGPITDLVARQGLREADGKGDTAAILDTAPAAVDEPAGSPGAIAERVRGHYPSVSVESVVATPAPGWYRMRTGDDIAYIDASARFLFDGDLIDLRERENLSRGHREALRREHLAALDPDGLLVYEPGGEVRETVTVFVDTSCPWCAKLHPELMRLVEAGVRVRYAMYPRAGRNAPAAANLRRVWCHDRPRKAIGVFFNGGQQVDSVPCDTPLEAHMEVASRLDVRGTPTLFTSGGRRIDGYRPAKRLLTRLGLDGAAATEG